VLKQPSSSISKILRQIMNEQPAGSWVAVSLDRKSVVGVGRRMTKRNWGPAKLGAERAPAAHQQGRRTNLPPGTYTIEAWHEKLGIRNQKITIAANETKSIDFVF